MLHCDPCGAGDDRQGALQCDPHHHERLDCSGYPEGLMGEAISLEGRIVAVADVFDAIVRRSWSRCWLQWGSARDRVQAALSAIGSTSL